MGGQHSTLVLPIGDAGAAVGQGGQ